MMRPYQDACIIIPTKHAKSIAVAPSFWESLGACVLEYYVDTDLLGTFSGERERKGSALECARRKCEWAINLLGGKVEYCIASEGSFGPHPQLPFVPCDIEILYFIDRPRRFALAFSLLLNIFVLIPVCVSLILKKPWVDAAYGPASPARGILLSIYAAIFIFSVFLLLVDLPYAVISLLALQIAYKITTPFTVGTLRNPVVVSNLAIAAFHSITISIILLQPV